MSTTFSQELASAEALATTEHLRKLKSQYDSELRKLDFEASHVSKFRYARLLACSMSRGATRRGIELLQELCSHLEQEPCATNPVNLPVSKYMKTYHDTKLQGSSSSSLYTQQSRIAQRKAESMVDGYVFLHRPTPGEDGDLTDRDGDADDLEEIGERATIEEEEEEVHESKFNDSDEDEIDDQFDSSLEDDHVETPGREIEDEDEDKKELRSLSRRLSCGSRGSMDLQNDCANLEANMLTECLYYIALAYYRLGDYTEAVAACDSLLEDDPANKERTQRLRTAAVYARLSRGALGVLVTVGMVVPAWFWVRGTSAE